MWIVGDPLELAAWHHEALAIASLDALEASTIS